jgi:hypothetical protein
MLLWDGVENLELLVQALGTLEYKASVGGRRIQRSQTSHAPRDGVIENPAITIRWTLAHYENQRSILTASKRPL